MRERESRAHKDGCDQRAIGWKDEMRFIRRSVGFHAPAPVVAPEGATWCAVSRQVSDVPIVAALEPCDHVATLSPSFQGGYRSTRQVKADCALVLSLGWLGAHRGMRALRRTAAGPVAMPHSMARGSAGMNLP